MGTSVCIHFPWFICLCTLLQSEICIASVRKVGQISPVVLSSCNGLMELESFGDNLDYSGFDFSSPFSTQSGPYDLKGCKDACLENCNCLMLFFESGTRLCFLFEEIRSLRLSQENSTRFVSFIKFERKEGSRRNNMTINQLCLIVIVSVLAFLGTCILYLGFRHCQKKRKLQVRSQSGDDHALEILPGTPVCYSYEELKSATNNFSVKLGKGGFGSVYRGCLSDGTQVAAKKLEGFGQGNKEFRAEILSIGSIRHVHLVKLKGYCVEGPYRILVYEYMTNGSLDKWIFKKNIAGFVMDWETRFNVALGMAKGLAYLHQNCDLKIIHCDIKPENVLLSDNYQAKVSDFGLAKFMNKEQNDVFTKLRGTRGYLAPEWIMNRAISVKSDVYSFGVVLLEIIGGRRNFDRSETSEKAHLPSYALKLMDEGKLREIVDPKLMVEPDDERVINAIKVALWCIQGDMHLRPSMTKVIYMLEGTIDIPQLPSGSSFYSVINNQAISRGLSQHNSGAHYSVELSGPR